MTTPAHTDFDSANPQGSQTPTAFASSALANDRALRDMAIAGFVSGFVQSRTNGTGTANQPQYITWYNSTLTIGFRWNITWTGTKPTTIAMEWSNDAGATWTAVGSAQVNTFDGSLNITGSTNSGGFFTVLLEVWAKVLLVRSDFDTHAAATGTAVHGLGTIATQNANAAALTGSSTFDGTGGVGQTTPPPADVTRIREKFNDYGTIAAAGTVTLELDKYAHFAFTPNATTSNTVTIALSGSPAAGKSQTFTLEIINGQRSADAKISWPAAFKWIGGSTQRPLDTALELSGRNIFVFMTRDGATRCEVQHLGKGG